MQFEDKGIRGPDISFYQGDPERGYFVNFEKMKSGVDFVIIKVGQDFWLDPAFTYNWKAAREVGIPRAGYWFLDEDGEGETQAERFWNALKDDPGEGPLIVDFEWGSGGWRLLYDFLFHLQRLSGYPSERIWIYTGYPYWIENRPHPIFETASLMWFAQFPLWIAWYTGSPENVEVPAPWITATMWQRGTTIVWGPDLGVHSLELDWNSFNGDYEEFAKYWDVEIVDAPELPDEGGDEVMKYKVIWNQGVARRTGPHTGNVQENTYTGLVYSLLNEPEVVEDNIPDENDPTNPNKVWVRFAEKHPDGRDLYGASSYPTSAGVPSVRMEKIEEPNPEPEPDEPQIVHRIDVFDNGEIAVDGGEAF